MNIPGMDRMPGMPGMSQPVTNNNTEVGDPDGAEDHMARLA